MKYLTSLLAFALFLTACGGTTSHTYEMQFNVDDKEAMANLAMATIRTVERRIARFEEEPLDLSVDRDEDKTFLHVELVNSDIAQTINSEILEPFSLGFLVGTDNEEEAKFLVEGHGAFKDIGITEEDVDWVFPGADRSNPKQGILLITFTEDGAIKMGKAFEEYDGKFMGLFIRDQLAAKIKVDNEQFEDSISISGLPSVELAEVFADDVNVGLHITFTEVE